MIPSPAGHGKGAAVAALPTGCFPLGSAADPGLLLRLVGRLLIRLLVGLRCIGGLLVARGNLLPKRLQRLGSRRLRLRLWRAELLREKRRLWQLGELLNGDFFEAITGGREVF